MQIDVTVDDANWSSALDRLLVLCREAAFNASIDGAEEIKTETQLLLTALHHAPYTKTPSPKGAPPAAISGSLAASITVRPDPDAEGAEVGPTSSASSRNGPYGRFLELGGVHEEHNDTGYMTWLEDSRWHRAKVLKKEPRPYLKPATEAVVDSGLLEMIYADHWARAIEAAA